MANLDADPWDGDWPKRTWDLLGIESAAALRDFIEAMGGTVEGFKRSRTYLANVDKIPFLRDL